MARVKTTALLPIIGGKFNGSQFVNTRSGLCLTNKSQPIQRVSRPKEQQRAVFKSLVDNWNGLSPADQATNSINALNFPFIDKFGDTVFYSGFQVLQQANLFLKASSSNPIAVIADEKSKAEDFTSIFFNANTGTGTGPYLLFDYEFYLSGTDLVNIVIGVSPPVSLGIDNYGGKYEKFYSSNQPNGIGRIESYPVPFSEIWQVDQKIFIEVKLINTVTGQKVFASTYQTQIFSP